MDIIGELPVEIAHAVFSFLSLKDVMNCSVVSSRWRNLVNNDHVWQRFYKKCRLFELNYLGQSTNESLNISGVSNSMFDFVRSYYSNLYKNWRTGRFSMFFAEIKYPQAKFQYACYGRQIAIFFLDKYELELLTVTNNGIHNKSILIYFGDLKINFVDITIHQDYIAISCSNIIYVVKQIGNGEIVVQRCYALIERFKNLICTESGFEDFINKYLVKNPHDPVLIYEIDLYDGILWMSDTNNREVIDIEKNITLFSSSEFPGFLNLSPKTFLCYSKLSSALLVTDQYGKILSRIYIMYKVLDFSKVFSNRNWVIFQYSLAGRNGKKTFDVYKISGEPRGSIEEYHVKKFLIHPTQGIVYLLIVHDTWYTLKAIDLETQNILWENQLESVPHRFNKRWTLKFIHNVYILAFPAPYSRSKVAIFNLQGKLLLVKSLDFVFDSFSLTGDLVVSKKLGSDGITSHIAGWKFF